MTADEKYMREAIKQAKKAYAIGEVPIGCVIVYQDKIIARGYNRRTIDKNTLAHAELQAIRKASKKMEDWRLEECTMYVTLEPCQIAFNCARIIFFSCVVRRTRSNERYPGSKLNPGTLTAPERFHLVLLRSRPDTVHGFSSRKTQISTPHTRGGFTRPMPSAQHHPCYSGLQVQGTATTPAARVILYRVSREKSTHIVAIRILLV